jgi:cell division protein ZapA
MGQVTITLNGRSYRLTCGEGEERRLLEVAEHVDDRLASLVAEFGQVGDERLLVMTALMIADELFDARAALSRAPAGDPATYSGDLTPGPPDSGETTAGAVGGIEPERAPTPSELMLRRVMRRSDSQAPDDEDFAQAAEARLPGVGSKAEA